jgi:hypothetical protein
VHHEAAGHDEYVVLRALEDVGEPPEHRRRLAAQDDLAGRKPEPGQLFTNAAGLALRRDDGTDHCSRPRPASSL